MSQNPLFRFAHTVRRRRTWFAGIFQAFLILTALLLAWLFRFDFSLPNRHALLIAAPLLVGVRLIAIARFGLLHGWWRYVGVSDVVDIIKADVAGSIGFFLIARYVFHMTEFPRSVYVSEALLTAGLLTGVRLLSRLLAETFRQNVSSDRKTILIGAGAGAQMVLRELKRSGSGYQVIACLDDDETKLGLKIQGVRVVGSVDLLADLFVDEQREECEVIISIPSATSAQMRRCVEIAQKAGFRYHTLPSLTELIAGDSLIHQIREVNLDDLLGREPVDLTLDALDDMITGQVVMVTGAAGSIGSELCRQILSCAPAKLVCVDWNENGIFHLQLELSSLAKHSELVLCVADVRDHERLRIISGTNWVKVIFHAAAYKHVPVMESNVEEAVRNNVFALLTLLDVAEEIGSRDLVLISSDKAVNPTSIMGATKRICELIVASRPPNGIRCTSVRFGNVLGSSGSVVPIFQEQLRQNLPLTITHTEVRRFFMTCKEAVALVLQAFAVGNHGDILVLDMGTPVKVVDLARTLARLAGKSENEVEIQFTGLRAGEKLSEQLFYATEQISATTHAKIKRTSGSSVDWLELLQDLNDLEDAVSKGVVADIVSKIKEIVPEFCSTIQHDQPCVLE